MDLAAISVLQPRFEPEDGLLVLDLDHGKANEMGTAQLDAFEQLCELIEGDTEVACLCTSSARMSKKGKPIFIAGANVTERTGWADDRIKVHVRRQRALMQRLRRLPIFTVALSHGVTLGWGVEFLLTADYTLATPTASFALPETGLGILPGARGTAELAAMIGPAQAMRMGCVGESIGSDEALRIGLVHECVRDLEAGLERTRIFARLLRKRSPTAVAAFKRASLNAAGLAEDERIELESSAYELCVDSGEAAIGREHFSAIRAGERPPWSRRVGPSPHE
jgi:enoyl-CoA hydratase/carnithine racemase